VTVHFTIDDNNNAFHQTASRRKLIPPVFFALLAGCTTTSTSLPKAVNIFSRRSKVGLSTLTRVAKTEELPHPPFGHPFPFEAMREGKSAETSPAFPPAFNGLRLSKGPHPSRALRAIHLPQGRRKSACRFSFGEAGAKRLMRSFR
jgi:hypothetical protein